MKALIILSLTLFSLNAMAALSVGVQPTTDCPFITAAKREAKPVVDVSGDDTQEIPVVKTKSK